MVPDIPSAASNPQSRFQLARESAYDAVSDKLLSGGKDLDADTADPSTADAFAALAGVTTMARVLGSYPAAPTP